MTALHQLVPGMTFLTVVNAQLFPVFQKHIKTDVFNPYTLPVSGFNSFISVCNQPVTEGHLSLPSLRGHK